MSSYSLVFCSGVFVWFLLSSGIDWCSLLIPKSPFPIRIRNQKTYPIFDFPSGKCALCLAFISWLKMSIKDRNRSLISRQANNPPCDITIIIVNMVFTFQKDLFDIKKSSHFVCSSLILLDIMYLGQLCACAVKSRFDIQLFISWEVV